MRKCSECKKVMIDGYVIEGGMAYYCSESCLHKNMTQEEFLVLYDDGEGDSYWTEWYEEDEQKEEENMDQFKMFDIVIHESTQFVFQFFDYLDQDNCRVMDEQEELYTFPISSIKKGTIKDLEDFKLNSAKKFRYLQAYL